MTYKLEMFRPSSAVIHLDNLVSNAKYLQSLAGESVFFCPVIKANAYGHGDIDVALSLQESGMRTLGVGLVEEGLLLRQMGVKSQILVFGTFDERGLGELLHHRLTPVVSSWPQLEILSQALKVPTEVHIKFDTGMHRLGFRTEDAQLLFERLRQEELIRVQGIMTHLHSAEDAQSEQGQSFQQLKKFSQIEDIFRPFTPLSHSLNSAGLLNLAELRSQGQADMQGVNLRQGARPGLALYGYSPLAEDPDLKYAMSLRSSVVQLHKIRAKDSVSYGATWRAGRDSVVGVIPIGYADGYHRLLSNRAYVLCEGRKVPVVGNVCMDYFMVDLTSIHDQDGSDLLLGSEVTLFGYDHSGQSISAKDLATQANTVVWEILTSISERVPRILEPASFVQAEANT